MDWFKGKSSPETIDVPTFVCVFVQLKHPPWNQANDVFPKWSSSITSAYHPLSLRSCNQASGASGASWLWFSQGGKGQRIGDMNGKSLITYIGDNLGVIFKNCYRWVYRWAMMKIYHFIPLFSEYRMMSSSSQTVKWPSGQLPGQFFTGYLGPLVPQIVEILMMVFMPLKYPELLHNRFFFVVLTVFEWFCSVHVRSPSSKICKSKWQNEETYPARLSTRGMPGPRFGAALPVCSCDSKTIDLCLSQPILSTHPNR